MSLEKLFDDIINQASLIASNHLGENLPEPEKIEFSEEHKEKMKKLFQKERRKLFFKKAARHSKRIALFLLAFLVASGITICSVEAWRIKVMNFIIEMDQTRSEINFGENAGDTYRSEEISFDYIPKGFQLEKKDVQDGILILVYENEERYFVFFMEKIKNKMGIDTENASVKKILINGKQAIYSSNDNGNILVWHDEEFSYRLSGNIEEREIIKMAENIKK